MVDTLGPSETLRKWSVVHIDPDIAWREFVAHTFETIPGGNQIGSFRSFGEGVEFIKHREPTLIVTDIAQTDRASTDMLAGIRPLARRARIILLTYRLDDVAIHCAESKGVNGFVWKCADPRQQLRAAVLQQLAGKNYFCEQVLSRMHDMHSNPDAYFKILSDHETSLLAHFGSGRTDSEIASATGLRPTTVKWHRHRILSRLGLKNTTELMNWTRTKGFLRSEVENPTTALSHA